MLVSTAHSARHQHFFTEKEQLRARDAGGAHTCQVGSWRSSTSNLRIAFQAVGLFARGQCLGHHPGSGFTVAYTNPHRCSLQCNVSISNRIMALVQKVQSDRVPQSVAKSSCSIQSTCWMSGIRSSFASEQSKLAAITTSWGATSRGKGTM